MDLQCCVPFLLYSKVIQLCMYSFLFKHSFLWRCVIGYWTEFSVHAEIEPVVCPFYIPANPDLPTPYPLPPPSWPPPSTLVLHTPFIYFGCTESLPCGLFFSCERRLPTCCYHGLLGAVASLIVKGFVAVAYGVSHCPAWALLPSQPVGLPGPGDRTLVWSCIGRWLLHRWATRRSCCTPEHYLIFNYKKDNMYFQW